MSGKPLTEKEQAEQQTDAFAGYIGIQRRLWRELRAGLLQEGVPLDLVDEATLTFIKHMTHSMAHSQEKK